MPGFLGLERAQRGGLSDAGTDERGIGWPPGSSRGGHVVQPSSDTWPEEKAVGASP